MYGLAIRSRIMTILLVSLVYSQSTFGQTSAVKLLDLSINAIVPTDTTANPDSVNMSVQFKISDVANASMVYLHLGSSPGVNDIKDIKAQFVQNNGKYFIVCNGDSIEVTGYEARMVIKCSNAELSTWTNTTLFVTDNVSLNTNSLTSP